MNFSHTPYFKRNVFGRNRRHRWYLVVYNFLFLLHKVMRRNAVRVFLLSAVAFLNYSDFALESAA